MTFEPGARCDTMFAFLSIDPDDDVEGIASFQLPGSNIHMPMVGADNDRVESMKGMAKKMAKRFDRRIEIVHFTNREHVEWIEP